MFLKALKPMSVLSIELLSRLVSDFLLYLDLSDLPLRKNVIRDLLISKDSLTWNKKKI